MSLRPYLAHDAHRRYRPDEMAGKFAGFQLPSMAEWRGMGEGRDHVAEPISHARLSVFHDLPPNVEVSALMPIEYQWLDVPGPTIRTPPAGRL